MNLTALKPKLDAIAQKEKANHYIVNIMMIVLFSAVLLLSLFGGVNVNIGAVHDGDGNDRYVRQSFFKVADLALNSSMTQKEAENYVLRVNDQLLEDYGVIGFNIAIYKDSNGVIETEGNIPPFENLEKFGALVDEVAQNGNANKVNWIKYRYAYSRALFLGNDTNMSNWQTEWRSSWAGHMSVVLGGQSIFITLFTLAMIAISLVMLIMAILAMVKKKPFSKSKFSLILLLIFTFARLMFRFDLIKQGWTGVFAMVLIFVVTVLYALMQHILMEKRDFSKTMFIKNAAITGGLVLSIILMLCPLFKLSSSDINGWYGWSYLFDFVLAEGAYTLVPMSYFLIALLVGALFMLHIIVAVALLLKMLGRFLSADYQENDTRTILIIILAINVIVYGVLGVSAQTSIGVSSLYITTTLNIALTVIQPLILAGLIAFELLYKAKPIKKEFIVR